MENAISQTLSHEPSSSATSGQTMVPGVYDFNGTLVDVTDRVTRLSDKVLTFISPEGVPYTILTQADGTFAGTIDTPVEERPVEQEVSYRSLNTSYDGNIKHIRFEAPMSAKSAKVRIFNILGQQVDEANYTLNGAGMFDVP